MFLLLLDKFMFVIDLKKFLLRDLVFCIESNK